MKVVLDTNVLVSGLLSPFGTCAEMVRMVSSGELSLCLDARVTTEYIEVLRRARFRFEEDKVRALIDQIHNRGCTVAAGPLPVSLPHRADDPFLEVALAADAQCLVTGNLHHFPAGLRRGMRVLSPAGFLRFYRKQIRSP